MDKQEAERRAELRRQHIARANKKLFDDTDRIKAFHSRLLLSEVLHEREAQIEYKKEMSKLHARREKVFVERSKEALEEAESRELLKLQDAQKKAFDQRDRQLEQLEEVRESIMESRRQKEEEGRQLRLKAEQEEVEHRRNEEERRNNARLANEMSVKANESLKEYRKAEAAKQALEEEKVKEYERKKDEMAEIRKERENEKERQKALRRERMVSMLEEQLLSARVETETRLQMQHREAEQRADDKERMRQEMMATERDAIHRSRQQQLSLRATKRAHEQEEETKFVDHWRVRNAQIAEDEKNEAIENFNKAKDLQRYHLRQQQRKVRQQKSQKETEMDDAMAAAITREEDDNMFKEYTQICIDEWGKRGRNIKPMLLQVTRKDTLAK